MAKQFSVNLVFNANTQQAKNAVKDLQKSLDQVTNNFAYKSSKGLPIFKELREANDAALKLRAALQAAMNPETGTLQLDKFNTTLRSTGMTVDQLKTKLMGAGQAGTQSWVNLTNAAIRAEKPIKQTNVMLDKMWTTMKNTMRWQLSAAALQGFIGAISTAFNYAKDLNGSLNNIRVVTGKSVGEMKDFAEQANKAAKALSTTTKAYTDAALIYYQQGLDNEEVLKRTDVTIKLANAVGESAKTVSEWMTAIWNNFDDGSKNLEYYADVMAALGAATASSADEIAQGLEKFAAIADTVGLSYEYATAALTTVTAQTRQSADVVGTAFKTMFARMQDLELGKTLEDGTSLGQYAQTLEKVGVQVLDASGELRDMDAVLNDLGARWKDLSSAEQVAVAQGVAGIRQYSQMLALMDNWDSFQTNLMTARTAEGALTEQADIYAESWEASSKRVKASAEAIYQSLLNDEFFIDLNNGLADTLDLLDKLLDSMGGMPGLLALIGAGVTKFLGPQLVGGVISLSNSIKAMSNEAQVTAMKMRQEIIQAGTTGAPTSKGQEAAIQGSKNMLGLQTKVDDLAATDVLSEKTNAVIQTQINHIEELNKQYLELAQNADKANKEMADAQDTLNHARLDVQQQNKADAKRAGVSPAKYNNSIKYDKMTAEINKYQQQAARGEKIDERHLKTLLAKRNYYVETHPTLKKMHQAQLEYEASVEKSNVADHAATEAKKGATKATRDYSKGLDELTKKAQKAQQITQLVQGISSLAFGLSSLSSAWDTLTNEDMSWWDKLLSLTMSLSMAIPMLISGFKTLKTAKLGELIATGLNTLAERANTKAKLENAAASDIDTNKTKANTAATNKNTVPNTANSLVKNGKIQGKSFYNSNTGTSYKLQKDGWHRLGKDGTDKLISEKQALQAASAKGAVGGKAPGGLGLLTKGGALAGVGILAGVALIAGGVALAKQFDKEYNKVDKAFEKAKKHTQAMREEYNRTAEAARTLGENIDKYSENHKNLNAMVKGTMEYREALLEANEQALELIKNNDAITSADYKIVDGQIVIDNEALERAQEEALNKQLNAQTMVTQASIEQNEAAVRKNRQDAARRMHVDEDGENWKQAGQGALVGGMVGGGMLGITATVAAMTGPIGWAIGGIAASLALLGGIVNEVKKDDESKAEKTAISALEKAYEDNPDLFANKENVKAVLKQADLTDKQINALLKNTDALQEVVESNRQLALQTRMYYEQMANNILSQSYKKYGIREEDVGAYIGSFGLALEQQQKDYQNREKTFIKQLNDNDKQIDQALTKMLGSDAKVTVGAYNGAGLKGNQVKIEQNGQTETITQTEAAQRIADHIQLLANTQGMSAVQEFWKGITGSGNGGFKAMVKELLGEDFTSGLEASVAQTKARDTQFKNINAALGTATDATLSVEARNAINTAIAEGETANLAAAGLTYQDLDELQDYLYKNWDSLDEVNVALEQAIREYDQDKREVMADANDAFDLSDETTADLQAALSWAEMSGEEFNAYADAVVEATGATKEFGNAIAESIIRYEKGATEALTTYLENMQLFKEADLMDADYSKKIAELEGTLEKWFDAELDTDFVREIASSNLFDEMLKGGQFSQDALNDLQKKVANAMLYGMDVDDETGKLLQDKIGNIFNDSWEVGETLREEHLAEINKLWTSSNEKDKAKVKEVIDMLEAYGFEVGEIAEGQEIVAEKVKYVGTEHVKFDKILDDVNENLEIEIDRYHDLEEALKDLSEATNYYKKVRDSLYNEGDSWWDKELTKARENIGYLKEYQERAAKGVQEDYDTMIKSARENNIIGTPTIDPNNGRITNWIELQENNYNSDAWKEFKDSILKYEESLNTYEEKSYALAEAKLEYLDQSIAKVTEETEKLTTLTEDSMKVLEFQFEYLGESAVDVADRIANIGAQMEATLANKGYYEDGLKDLFANYTDNDGNQIFSKDAYDKLLANDFSFLEGKPVTEDFVKQIRAMRDGLMETYNSLDGFKEKIQEEVINGFEKWTEEFEDNTKALEHNMKVLEGYRNVIDLLGKDMLGISDEVLAQASAAAVNIAVTQMQGAKEQFEFAKNALAEAQTAFDAGILDEEAFEKIQDSYREAELGLTETLASSIEAINTEFENSLNAIMDNFDKAVGGIFGSLDEIQTWFDRQEELEDWYLKPYEKTYEINTLNREIQDAIQNSDNLKYQRELNDLSSELLAYQEEGVEMSDQDLEYMQKRFEVMKAQAAFEEAQNAKREVRLTRDSQGNYSYVYTANEEAVNKAQADLDKSIYELDKHFDEVQSSLNSMYLKTTQEYADAVAALDKTSETYEQDLQRVTDFYSQRLSQIEGEISGSLIRAADANKNYGTQAKTAFNELVIGQMYTDVESFSDLHNNVVLPNIKSVTEQVTSTYNTWKDNVDKVFDEAGVSVEYFGKEYAKIIGDKDKGTGIEGKTNELGEEIKGLKDDATTGFSGIVKAATDEFTKFETKIKEYKEALDPLLTNLNEFLKQAAAAENVTVPGENDTPDGNPPPVDDSDQWQVTGYVSQAYDTKGNVVAGGGIEVKNLTTGKTKIVRGSELFDVNSDQVSGAYTTNRNATYRDSKKNITSMEGLYTNQSSALLENDPNAKEVEGRGVYFNDEGEATRAIKLGGKWYDQSKITTDDIVDYGRAFSVDENIESIDEKEILNYKTPMLADSKYQDTQYDYQLKNISEGTIPLYQLSNGKWYTKDELAFSSINPYDLNNYDENYDFKMIQDKYYTPLTDNPKYTAPSYDTITLVANTPNWAGLHESDTTLYDEQGKKNKKGGYSFDDSITIDGYIQNGDTGLYHLASPITAKSLWNGKSIGKSYFLNRTDIYQALERSRSASDPVLKKKGWYNNFRLRTSFDTGGYTGSWGPEGRMAMLHQKEIVLNAHDTENFLTAVQIVRSMADKLELSARAAQQGLGALVHASTIPGESGTLEQNVTIHAEFPNATDHSEIEEAFRNLATTAIQFARPRI